LLRFDALYDEMRGWKGSTFGIFQEARSKIVLWTNSMLLEARHIYEKTGFKLVAEEAHHSFGHDLIGETWELAL
jgi:hypothetical protein